MSIPPRARAVHSPAPAAVESYSIKGMFVFQAKNRENGMVDADETTDAQILAATRVSEKDMRELLPGLSERDPKT